MPPATKILVVFGTRPEAIKLFPLVHELRTRPECACVVLSTGQHRGMLDQVLQIAGITVDHELDVMRQNQSLDDLTAQLIRGVGRVLDKEKPDWVVVQGDTATAMAAALSAYYRKVEVCHVEAGLRSRDKYNPWPEEINRKIIGTIASLHCAPTATAAEALSLENTPPEQIFVTGNTVIDALRWVTDEIGKRPELASVIAKVAAEMDGRKIIGVTTHRRENFGDGMRSIAQALRTLAMREDVGLIFPIHLNPNVREVMLAELGDSENIALLDPLDYPNFAALLQCSYLMLTDSGGVQEEAPAFGKPVLVMRETTERPEGVIAGTAKLVGTRTETIVAEVTRLLDDTAAYEAMARAHSPFGDGTAARQIAELILAPIPDQN